MTTQSDKLPVTESLSGNSMDNISKQPSYADYPSMVNVYSSDNVHVGPKNIYKGNVSITHIVLPDGKSLVGGADDSEQLDKLPEKIISDGDYICQTQGQVFNISNGKIPTASPLIRIETRDEKTPKIFQKRFVVYASIAVCFILLSTVIYLLKFGIHAKSNDGRYSGTYNKDEKEEIYHHFIYRQSWVAQPPLKAGTRLEQPIPEVEILHTATDFCYHHNYCSTLVRNIQDYQIGSGNFDDIAYNFLVSGNGYVYEGRGWDTVSASVQGRNNFSVSIALIGTFTATAPSDLQITALSRFMGEGVKYGRLASNYSLHAHCQWSDTKSPGVFVVDILKKMAHWNETCNQCCTS